MYRNRSNASAARPDGAAKPRRKARYWHSSVKLPVRRAGPMIGTLSNYLSLWRKGKQAGHHIAKGWPGNCMRGLTSIHQRGRVGLWMGAERAVLMVAAMVGHWVETYVEATSRA